MTLWTFCLFSFCLTAIVFGQNEYDFWGNTLVTAKGITQESSSYGYANVRYNQLHDENSRFPIGSNTKLFTAVAIYQLQEKGLLNVTDPISKYLNKSDFIKFGYPNISHYCPHYIDSPTKCEYLSFIDILSMSSGIVASLDCPYNNTSPFKAYCWDFCSFIFLPYKGSIAYYVGTFIEAPLTFKPGTKYVYSNMGFILAGYLIETISGMNYGEYIQNNILSPLGLENMYYDPFDGQFGVNQYRVDGYYLFIDEKDPSIRLGTGWCAPYMSLGSVNAAGGLVSNNKDLHTFYSKLFNNSAGYIPPIFQFAETLKSIVYPYNYIGDGVEYYAQGVIVIYKNGTNHSDLWPDEIVYSGGTLCDVTAIRMVPNETQLIVTAFTNAPVVLVDGQKELNNLKYSTPLSFCEMSRSINTSYFVESRGGNANLIAHQLLKQYSG